MATIPPAADPRAQPLGLGRRLTAGERRQQLVDVSLALFAARGYRSTTMDDIAEAAGVTKPLLYQHFSSKRALYLELVESVARDLVQALTAATSAARGPRQQVEDGFVAYFEFLAAHETAFRLLYGRDAELGDRELGDALRWVEDAIASAIDPLIDAGLDDEHRRILSHAVVGMAEGASRRWIEGNRAGGAPEHANGTPPPAATALAGPSHECAAVEEATQSQARRMARRIADLAWAGLRSVHAD